MNKTHAIAKIVVVTIGVYLLIESILVMLRPIIMVAMAGNHISSGYYWLVAVVVMFGAAFIAAVYYFLIHRASNTAQKIVGKEDLPDPINPSAWFPFALRLAAVIAGFFTLTKAISTSLMVFNAIYASLQTQGAMGQFYTYLFYTLVQLAISIYLFCGAPHFVRWQMRKTREFCNRFSA
jgi:hypothetical protein